MRIVIVEDETLIRKNVRKILKSLDGSYELVGEAENGKKGLEIIRRKQPEVVIVDIHMPDMDGLTMLEKMREEGIDSKAIILTAYSDFNYAKRAIEIGVEGYLLKPINVDEFCQVLQQTEQQIVQECAGKHFMNIEKIFLNAITGQWSDDKKLEKIIEEKYGISSEETIVLMGINLGEQYEKYHDSVRSMLENADKNTTQFESYIMEFSNKKVVLMMLYRIFSYKELNRYFQHRILPMLCSEIQGEIVCTWGSCEGLLNIRPTIIAMDHEVEWNLFFGNGVLISEEKIAKTTVYPLKYPIHIESQLKAAFLENKMDTYKNSIHKLREYCRREACSPHDMKEAAIRCFLAVFAIAKESGRIHGAAPAKNSLEMIAKAISWNEIEKAFLTIFIMQESETIGGNGISALVQKALQYIHEYYNQGIKLEEIAHDLNVSEEYLSAQFRKETGKTFSVIVREYKIEKVKELLTGTSLRMRQIADMAGYSDAKYMSKVFKAETGMLPSEYRKKETL